MYRPFKSGDEKQIVDCWNDVLIHDPITSERFCRQVMLDANFDPEGLIVAEENGEVIGAILSITRKLPMYKTELEEDTAWISFFFVKSNLQRTGVGKELLKRACNYAKSKGAEKIFFSSYAPNYFVPGIDEERYPSGFHFLKATGFRKLYSPVAMHRALTDYVYPNEVKELKRIREAEGYTFGKVKDGDFYELIHFANEVFNPDWGRAIREGVLQGLNPSQILVAKRDETVVGFALYGGYEGIRERFGPFGVDPAEQGKGLGKILLHETLQSMRAKTLHGAWFLWTSEKSSAGHLYLKNGFKTFRTFHVMLKEL